ARATARRLSSWSASKATGIPLAVSARVADRSVTCVSRRVSHPQSAGLETPDIRRLGYLLVGRHVGVTGCPRGLQQNRVGARLRTLDCRGELELMHRHHAIIVPRSRNQRRRVAGAIMDVVER